MNDENTYTAPDGKRYVAVEVDNQSCGECAMNDPHIICAVVIEEQGRPSCHGCFRKVKRNIIWKLETMSADRLTPLTDAVCALRKAFYPETIDLKNAEMGKLASQLERMCQEFNDVCSKSVDGNVPLKEMHAALSNWAKLQKGKESK